MRRDKHLTRREGAFLVLTTPAAALDNVAGPRQSGVIPVNGMVSHSSRDARPQDNGLTERKEFLEVMTSPKIRARVPLRISFAGYVSDFVFCPPGTSPPPWALGDGTRDISGRGRR